MTSSNTPWLRNAALIPLAVAGLWVAPAHAFEPPDDDDPRGLECISNATASLSATPQTVNLGQSATVGWHVQVPSGCGALTQTVNGQAVGRSGSLTVQPMANTSFTLRARIAGLTRQLATVRITVVLPPTVTINANNQVPLLVQALGTENTVINVANHVQLDLSGREGIRIGRGVRLIGGRTPRQPGGRLYTTTYPWRLFAIEAGDGDPTWGDNVRITGLRIEGGTVGVADSDASNSVGIRIQSRLNVEIDNVEIYGWRGSAIEVVDDLNRIGLSNPMTVRVHDSYIHHNQHELKFGYGVVISNGAYALIEKNVFDWNRHAIAGDGSDGSGYLAYRNLVLEHGGLTYWALGSWAHTHMFDMHGQESCWGHRNCGRAGEYMDIRYNSFLYTAGGAFTLRGTPSIRADVAHNVFAHPLLFTSYGHLIIPGALDQTESGLNQWDNLPDVDESHEYGQCDFDADGIADDFFATGQTWWFSSGGDRPWVYLNTSTRRRSELSLGDLDHDGRCDVAAGGVVASGGTGAWKPLLTDILWQHGNGQLAVWSMDAGSIAREAYPGVVDSSWQIKGTGDFDGDEQGDILWQHTGGQVAIWYMSGGVKLGEGYPGAQVPATWVIQGVGDFDGDGRSDVLWRDAGGQIAIWFKGDLADTLYPAVYPGYANVPAPVDRSWQVKGLGDFDGDGRSDILWRHTNGQVAIWRMAGGVRVGESYPGGQDQTLSWAIQGVADFDNDGRADILWRDGNGQLAIWFSGEATRAAYPSYQNVPGPGDLSWQVQGVSDYDADGRADILWRSSNGQVAIWFMAGGQFVGEAYPRQVSPDWVVKGLFRNLP